jgi:hypothetical protein
MVIGAGIEGAGVRIVLHKSDSYEFTFSLFISRAPSRERDEVCALRRVTKLRIVTRPASTVPSAAEIPAHGVIQAPGKREPETGPTSGHPISPGSHRAAGHSDIVTTAWTKAARRWSSVRTQSVDPCARSRER